MQDHENVLVWMIGITSIGKLRYILLLLCVASIDIGRLPRAIIFIHVLCLAVHKSS